jgi:hypothetical protein
VPEINTETKAEQLDLSAEVRTTEDTSGEYVPVHAADDHIMSSRS